MFFIATSMEIDIKSCIFVFIFLGLNYEPDKPIVIRYAIIDIVKVAFVYGGAKFHLRAILTYFISLFQQMK